MGAFLGVTGGTSAMTGSPEGSEETASAVDGGGADSAIAVSVTAVSVAVSDMMTARVTELTISQVGVCIRIAAGSLRCQAASPCAAPKAGGASARRDVIRRARLRSCHPTRLHLGSFSTLKAKVTLQGIHPLNLRVFQAPEPLELHLKLGS
ncbi:hypothetical protein G7046_g10067 [Stylonectria norvegica]|nr:hypothetical protein G7046_g10067 [Stylonectria norvegica]